MKKLVVGVLAIVAAAAAPAHATIVTSLPTGTVVGMPALDYFGGGPQAFGPGITWSSTNTANQGGSVFGYTSGYGFGANGVWDGALGPMAGVNDSRDVYGVTDTMTFALSTPVFGIGGFVNYFPGSANSTVLSVYDSSLTLLETLNLTFNTGGGTNTGQFVGFLRPTADISYFTLTDNYVGITNLTLQDTNPVPEPGTLLLLGSGLSALVLRRRRAA